LTDGVFGGLPAGGGLAGLLRLGLVLALGLGLLLLFLLPLLELLLLLVGQQVGEFFLHLLPGLRVAAQRDAGGLELAEPVPVTGVRGRFALTAGNPLSETMSFSPWRIDRNP
jgi:hypothetical protein